MPHRYEALQAYNISGNQYLAANTARGKYEHFNVGNARSGMQLGVAQTMNVCMRAQHGEHTAAHLVSAL
jgi:hypothetical protein